MNGPFLLLSGALLIVALVLLLRPLRRGNPETARRLAETGPELRALNEAYTAGTVDPQRYAARRAALGEALLATLDVEPKRYAPPSVYTAVAVAFLLPLTAVGTYRWFRPAEMGSEEATVVGQATVMEKAAVIGQATVVGQAATPVDHGVDMQAAIAHLADKLRQNPDDADGWALLGRTYKATQHYAEARDAFRQAVKAAPGDADLARELADAENPDSDVVVEAATPLPNADADADAVPGIDTVQKLLGKAHD